MSLENQVAVVTGAAQGIGRGIVLSLAKRNVRVICLDRNEEENQKTAADAAAISRAGSAAYTCDVADPKQVSDTFDRILETEGRIDILVNNAGVFRTMSFVKDSYEDALANFEFHMNVNARGTFLCSKKAAPFMARQGSGQILNVVTNHMKRYLFPPSDSEHGYDASKWAQHGLNESLDCELKPYGIRVNGIYPAATRSAMLQGFFDDLGIPLNKQTIGECSGQESLLEIEEVGEAACHILEWDNTQPTGKAILLMYSEDCEKLKDGFAQELAR